MNRRGVTLMEVLVAIFVMGIGLLSLLSLFPLGVLRMSGAVQDQSSAQLSRNAVANANFMNVRNDPLVVYANPTLPNQNDLFANPWPAGSPLLPADPHGPSYPIVVDPIGYIQTAGLSADWLTLQGNTPPGNTIRRRPVSFVTNSASALGWFSGGDDTLFSPNGSPQWLPATQTFQRQRDYSWTYLLKRPRTSDKAVVNLSVMLFKSRVTTLNANTMGLNEFLYQTPPGQPGEVSWNSVANTITIDVTASGNVLPPVRVGGWLLDASYVPSPTNPAYASVNGKFYHVTQVTENSPTSITCEVEQPLWNFPLTGAPSAWQKVIYLEGLVDVYEKGTGSLP